MSQRIARQCLRTGQIRLSPSRTHRHSIRTYSSAAPAEQPIDPEPPHPQPSESKPSTSPPKSTKSRRVLTQGICFHQLKSLILDLLPFDPPPRPSRRIPVELKPFDEETTVESVYPSDKRGPIPLRIRKPFPVNQSWELLHKFYATLFGFEDYLDKGFMTKDLAWQTVTYKSYNHGIDPYNEKLAHLGHLPKPFKTSRLFVGKRAIRMVAATHVLDLPGDTPQINNLNVNALSKSLMANIMDYHLIGDMGLRYGVAEVMRWKPAFVSPIMACNLLITER